MIISATISSSEIFDEKQNKWRVATTTITKSGYVYVWGISVLSFQPVDVIAEMGGSC